MALAVLTEPSRYAPPGWVYMLMPVVMPIYGTARGRVIRRMKAAQEAAA